MCIIVYKAEDVPMPTEKILQTCFMNNPDGAGYMYRNPDTSITIRKGYMTADSLIQSLNSIRDIDQKELVIHFRFGTHGDKSPGNTHPFPITNKIHMLRRLRMTVDYALVHNGVVSGMTHRDATLSDTMCLIKLMANESEESKYIQAILENGKFIIMDRTETRMYGHFYTDETTGIIYSNETYKPVQVYTSYGRWYDLLDYTDEDAIKEYNEQYGTEFKTLEEIDNHIQMLDLCDDCIWYEELTGQCWNTGQIANPDSKECNFIKWNSHVINEDREIVMLPAQSEPQTIQQPIQQKTLSDSDMMETWAPFLEVQ